MEEGVSRRLDKTILALSEDIFKGVTCAYKAADTRPTKSVKKNLII
jgi:hypothetical protein